MVKKWSENPNLGICAVTRDIFAIDCDCATPELTKFVVEYFAINICQGIPLRIGNAGRGTLLLRVESPEPLAKSKITLRNSGGIIEFLGSRQHTMLAGMHSSGVRYFWPDGLPTTVPTISLKDFNELWRALADHLGSGEQLALQGVNERATGTALSLLDPFAQVLRDAGIVRAELGDKIAIECPWSHTHSGPSGLTASTYMTATTTLPANYRCQHAHCADKNISHLHELFSFKTDDFADVALVDPPKPVDMSWSKDPAWTRKPDKNKELVIDLTEPANIVVALKYPALTGGKILNYDSFTTLATVWDTTLGESGPGFQELKEVDVSKIRNALSSNPYIRLRFSQKEVEAQIQVYLSDNSIDSAKNAMENMPAWDGVERLKYYSRDILKAEHNSYTEDIGLYIFMAATARIIHAPIQIDGVPVLIGKQNCRKTTVIKGMALRPDYYVDMTFNDNQNEMFRQIAGRSIVGLDELAGMHKSVAESTKTFITKETDTWTPKYSNHTVTQPRRCFFVGSTNTKRFLVDPTGERRMLPVHVAVTGEFLDTDLQEENLQQYYAEALHLITGKPKAVRDVYARIIRNPLTKQAHWDATKIAPGHKQIIDYLDKLEDPDKQTVHAAELYAQATGSNGVKEYLLVEIGQSLKVLGYECVDLDTHCYKKILPNLE